MAAMDDCIEYVSQLTPDDWEAYHRWRLSFRGELSKLRGVRIVDAYTEGEGVRPEPGKILLCPTEGMSTQDILAELHNKKTEPELVLPGYVVLITSVIDRDKPFAV